MEARCWEVGARVFRGGRGVERGSCDGYVWREDFEFEGGSWERVGGRTEGGKLVFLSSWLFSGVLVRVQILFTSRVFDAGAVL